LTELWLGFAGRITRQGSEGQAALDVAVAYLGLVAGERAEIAVAGEGWGVGREEEDLGGDGYRMRG
jgi:hypothetical protein